MQDFVITFVTEKGQNRRHMGGVPRVGDIITLNGGEYYIVDMVTYHVDKAAGEQVPVTVNVRTTNK